MKPICNFYINTTFFENLTCEFCSKNARSYLVYGKEFINQRSTTFDAQYKFSGKERDMETGYGYFGARYYSSELGIWISTDPMAGKYPSSTPYAYCRNNPIMLVDPNGMDDDVVITGKAAREATNQLQAGLKNISITRDESTGKLSYDGTAKTKKEKEIANAIDSKEITNYVTAIDSKTFKFNGETFGTNGGSFLGNDVCEDENGNTHVDTYQVVNPEMLKNNFTGGKSGKSMKHELSEAYQGGIISLKSGKSSPMSGEAGSVYNTAHNKALPQGIYTGSSNSNSTPTPTLKETINNINKNIIFNNNVFKK
jgi:RHS repeat-associated protein